MAKKKESRQYKTDRLIWFFGILTFVYFGVKALASSNGWNNDDTFDALFVFVVLVLYTGAVNKQKKK